MNFNYVFMPIIIFVAGVFIIWLSSRRILALSKKTYPAWRKIVERAVLSMVILVAVTIAGYPRLMRSPFRVFGPAIRRLESWSMWMVTECT